MGRTKKDTRERATMKCCAAMLTVSRELETVCFNKNTKMNKDVVGLGQDKKQSCNTEENLVKREREKEARK